ncbi:uncharacterized protein TNCV_396621 [Trichonephila clavipes]|nr:uncharacterized protein TNCV_396621 [Trichonephila clavipes]
MGSPHTSTIVITTEIESGFIAKDDLILFHCTVQFPRAWHHSKQRRRWVGVKNSTRNGLRDPKCPSARRYRMVREDTGFLVKVLPVPGWWSMKQLPVRTHFLRCGGLRDWSVEGILSLVFV